MKLRDPFNRFSRRKVTAICSLRCVAPKFSVLCAMNSVSTFGGSWFACALLLLSVSIPQLFAQTNSPIIAGVGQPWLNTDKQTRDPFPNAVIVHPDGSPVTVTIVVSPAGFGGFQATSGLVVSGVTNIITLRSTGNAQSFLRGLTFVPLENQVDIGSSQPITFAVWATGTNNLSSATNSSTTVTVTPVNDSPTLAGTITTSTTDKVGVRPFPNVTIADVDNRGTQTVAVTITLDDSAKGAIQTGSSGFTFSSGSYVFTGPPANATTAIRQLVFAPTENRRSPGLTETTTFTVIVTDASNASVTSSASTVTATSINDAPAISGISPPHFLQTGRSLNPFPDVVVADPDPVDNSSNTNIVGAQRLSLVVRLTGANISGTLEAPGFSGTMFALSGITPQEATAQLRELVYRAQSTPLTTTNSVGFSITTTDTSNASATNTATVVNVFTLFTPPGLSGTRSEQRVNDNNTVSLFSSERAEF